MGVGFELSSKDISLDKSTLKAKCRKNSSTEEWSDSTLDLNSYIGNKDGDFTTESSGFYANSTNVSLVIVNGRAVLKASLYTSDHIIDRTFELTHYVGNDDGKLTFEAPSKSILESVSDFSMSGGILKANAIGIDGHVHSTTIDLDNYYGNIDGNFKAKHKDFSKSATDIKAYNDQGIAVPLTAQLTKKDGKTKKDALIMLDLRIENIRGNLAKKK